MTQDPKPTIIGNDNPIEGEGEEFSGTEQGIYDRYCCCAEPQPIEKQKLNQTI